MREREVVEEVVGEVGEEVRRWVGEVEVLKG